MADGTAAPGLKFTFLDYVGLGFILTGVEELLRRPREGWPIWIPGFVLGFVALAFRDRSPQLVSRLLGWFRAPKRLSAATAENVELKKQLEEFKVSAAPRLRLKIIEAHYGVEGINNPDVTPYLLERLHGNSYAELVGADLFHGFDPLPGKPNKILTVRYSFDGKEMGIVRPEHEWLILPEDMFLIKLLNTQQKHCTEEKQTYARRCLEYREQLDRYAEEKQELQKQANNANAQLAIFSPLQIEALGLSKDILKFISEMGPRPTLDKEDFGFNKAHNSWENADQMQEFLVANSNIERPWALKFISTWEADFAPRVDSIVPKIGKAGIDAIGLKNMNLRMNKFSRNNEVFDIAKSLFFVVVGLDTMKAVPILDEAPK